MTIDRCVHEKKGVKLSLKEEDDSEVGEGLKKVGGVRHGSGIGYFMAHEDELKLLLGNVWSLSIAYADCHARNYTSACRFLYYYPVSTYFTQLRVLEFCQDDNNSFSLSEEVLRKLDKLEMLKIDFGGYGKRVGERVLLPIWDYLDKRHTDEHCSLKRLRILDGFFYLEDSVSRSFLEKTINLSSLHIGSSTQTQEDIFTLISQQSKIENLCIEYLKYSNPSVLLSSPSIFVNSLRIIYQDDIHFKDIENLVRRLAGLKKLRLDEVDVPQLFNGDQWAALIQATPMLEKFYIKLLACTSTTHVQQEEILARFQTDYWIREKKALVNDFNGKKTWAQSSCGEAFLGKNPYIIVVKFSG
ncbi:unnamed protein product [Didymodactylos carnosus]|uniref:Uncharacterized protein n=1 Tax=Didymodactylos carnosus TaxID=1234261 RepID=A0A813NVH0_9BILA|nr:unnamed protein product [Didymodactylos carnosus]CAF0853081.1 unnamed protein product [Didymodactylos carnosus]CAF3523875.1 unnamed protein product [Didymodactylos carnosus]CAF3638269.1 unnamed protein product [Didymodactylos carnosus]